MTEKETDRSGHSSSGTERNDHGEFVRDCPACDGEIALLEHLNVWLCDRGDHAYPCDEWKVDTEGDRNVE